MPAWRLHGRWLLQAADLRVPGELPARRGLLAGALVALVAACGGKPDPGKIDVDDPNDIGCDIDPSLDYDSAFELTLGSDNQDTFCPRRDEDFWHFRVDAPNQLVRVSLAYDKLTPMQLGLTLRGPVGACVPTAPTSCTSAEQCADGEICDTQRGGCRRAATGESCTLDSQCEGGEHCVSADLDRASFVEETQSGSAHRLNATFAAPIPGDYWLLVSDNSQQLSDGLTKYRLNVSLAAEPDTHEPNDTMNLAAPLTSGEETTGYLSHLGRGQASRVEDESDIDWYLLTPDFASQPVVVIELSWPASAPIAPTFALVQGAWSFPSNDNDVRTVGTGASASKVRKTALVAPAGGNVWVKVTNTNSTSSTDVGYTLTATFIADANEGANRNDTPETATVFNAGTPSSGSPPTTNVASTIAAQNDQDWLRIDKAAGYTQNSLLYIRAEANAPTDAYLLTLTVYKPTGSTCSAQGTCANGGRCVTGDNQCIAPWVQRPSPDGPGDPQIGGLSPNHIETQLPVFGTGPGVLYVLVTHNNSTFLELDGYSATDGYTVTMSHKVEPDAGDLTTTDNKFVARPLMEDLGRDDFYLAGRTIGDGAGTPAAGGSAFAALTSVSRVTAATCSTLTFAAFDGSGVAATGTTSVGLTADGGAFYASCADTTTPITTFDITGASGSVAYDPPAVNAPTNTVTTDVGGVTQPQHLAVVGATTQALQIIGANAIQPPRGVPVNSDSEVLRITLPAVAAQKILTLTASGDGSPTVRCADSEDGTCLDLEAPLPAGLTDPCTPAGQPTCQIVIKGGQSYDVRVHPTATGAVRLDVVDPAGINASTTWVGTALNPASFGTTTAITGYLSYDGDQDFFELPLPTGFPKAGLTMHLTYGASAVDVRATATRAGLGAIAGPRTSDDADACDPGSCPGPGSCDARNQCSQPAYNASTGANGDTPECVFMYNIDEDNIEVWVNDVNANDWDEGTAYSITVSVEQGCPSSCNGFICGQ